MNVNVRLEGSAQLAEGCELGLRAVGDSAVVPKPIIVLDAFADYAVLDDVAFGISSIPRVVVSLVCMQIVGQRRGLVGLTRRWQSVDQFIQRCRIVRVGFGDSERQRDALAIRHEIALAAGFTSVRGTGSFRGPRWLATRAHQC